MVFLVFMLMEEVKMSSSTDYDNIIINAIWLEYFLEGHQGC